MRALITGVDGFVGYHLSNLLIEEGLEVHGTSIVEGYSNKQVTLHSMNLLDKENVENVIKQVEPDAIYHLAGQSAVGLSWDKPTLTMDINVNGTIHLLDAVRQHAPQSKVLIIGSSDQYGPVSPDMCPIKEEQPLGPVSPYGISKATQEQMAKLYQKAYGMNIIMVRAFNHIGPKQGKNFVIADFASKIVAIERGAKPVLEVGNLEAARDFADVRDIVKAYKLLIEKGRSGEVYNVGSGKSIKINQILKLLLAKSKANIEVKIDPLKLRPVDVPLVECDNTKLKNHTGWNMVYSIEATLQDTLEYWRSI